MKLSPFIVHVIALMIFGTTVDLCAADQGDIKHPPNFILILADDLGYGDIGCNGSQLIKTPNIDLLAEEGVRLTSFYSCANLCTPALARYDQSGSYYRPGLLFDLDRDPGESYSYAREYPEVVERLWKVLHQGQRELKAMVPTSMWSRP